MKWVNQELIENALERFVLHALPDAHDWRTATYRIAGFDGRMMDSYEIETEIPTSGEDCWVLMRIARNRKTGAMELVGFQAIMCEAGGEVTYVCNDPDGAWETVS
ncbi:MAG: hypothetical protein Q4C09_02780 [Atopobiaceae bacterium]|nr:hypothetical protein [Atopobiaceae bacterium]